MKLYIASTSGYSGKTLLALALSRIWSNGGVSVGYVKPLGKIPVMGRGRSGDGGALLLPKGRAVEKPASRFDVLLLGGAANLRDGFFLGLSPLDIISSLDCRVLLLDRFMGEKSMDQVLWAGGILGERLLGVVLNHVAASQEAFVRDVVRPYIEAGGIRGFGAIPADPVMDSVLEDALG